ncbi:MAG: BlaI/MecI/CopY family transcriptional regulator [Lachnospiraceae bacterium]
MELSQTELFILEFLWAQDEPQGFSSILQYYNEKTKKDWKKQTMSTYLTRLQKAGFLKTDHSDTRKRYYPAISREEYYQDCASCVIDETFQGSLSLFVSAFTGRNRISEEEKEQLLEYLKRL